MKAVRKVSKAAGFELSTIDIPSPKPDEVLIKCLAVSLCGTDLHVKLWDPPFKDRMSPPVTTGHEVCGIVEQVGCKVSNLKVGDVVSAESHLPCLSQGFKEQCATCLSGASHACERVRFFSVDVDGFLAEYATAPANILWKNPPTMPRDIAALQESLGNSVYTVLESKVEGKKVVVFGMGPTGQNAFAVARHIGAEQVICVAGSAFHIELAKKMGATDVINRHRADVVREVRELTGGKMADVCLEMSGNAGALNMALDCVKTTGMVTILGLYPSDVSLDVSKKIVLKDVTLRGIYGRKIWSTWESTSNMLQEGLDISAVITHRYEDISRFEEAFDAMERGECGKAMFFPHGIDALECMSPATRASVSATDKEV